MQSLLETPVLVLNRLWQPVNTCSARRAIALLYLGHAQVVDADGQNNFDTHDFASWVQSSVALAESSRELVHSVKRAFRIPRIIVLAVFDRLPKKEVKFTRQNIFARDGYLCQYCGKKFENKDLNLDHVIPRDKGGRTTWENLVCSCIRCNSRKSNKMPREANMFPLKEPKAPRWRPSFSGISALTAHASWRHFIDLEPSSVQVST